VALQRKEAPPAADQDVGVYMLPVTYDDVSVHAQDHRHYDRNQAIDREKICRKRDRYNRAAEAGDRFHDIPDEQRGSKVKELRFAHN
jgi:hypothetical protein